ncbi:MAG: DUF4230 domain-containing protein [Spirochaetaceae bacterium]|nr:DUF4230 domain-containing protein [Spirochaetaceae bacterium]
MAKKKQENGAPSKDKSRQSYWIAQSLLILFILIGLFLLFSPLSPLGIRTGHIAMMEQKVRSLGELVTVDQLYRDVIYRQEKRLISDKRILFSMDFHIKAGLSLENARVSMDRAGVPHVTLDPPKIISLDADELSIQQIFIREQFAQIYQSDYMEVIMSEKERLQAEALESGLLTRAQQQAEFLIRQIFRMAGYDQIILDFREQL